MAAGRPTIRTRSRPTPSHRTTTPAHGWRRDGAAVSCQPHQSMTVILRCEPGSLEPSEPRRMDGPRPGPSPTDLGLARDRIVGAQVDYSRLAMARPIARQDARERSNNVALIWGAWDRDRKGSRL